MKTAGLLLGAALMAACASSTASFPTVQGGQFGGRPVVGISNATNLIVTLFVNDKDVGTAIPGVGMEPIDFATLPPLPWAVEARSPSGRVLTSMNVNAGDVSAGQDANGNLTTKGAMGRVDLSCGRVTIWAAYNQPSGPQPPSPAGSLGDCEP